MKSIFFVSVESVTLTKMDRLTVTKRAKFSSAMKHILHSMAMLINIIVVFGVLRILKELKRGHYIQEKSLFGALFGTKILQNSCLC